MAADQDTESELTRPPDDQDLVALARELNRLQAKYIVIGGLAINRLGFIRATYDIDLLLDKSKANQDAVKKALEILPDQAIKELTDDDLSQWLVVRVNDEITVDLMTKACGISYQQAQPGIEWETLQGVPIPFAGKSLMRQLKQGSRDKDKIDLNFLDSLD